MIIDAYATDTTPSHEVRRRALETLANEGEPMSEVTYDAFRKRVKELETALKQARRDALEEAAKWHDEQAKRWQNTYVKESLSGLDMQAARVMCLEHGGFHIESAAAIRALGEKE